VLEKKGGSDPFATKNCRDSPAVAARGQKPVQANAWPVWPGPTLPSPRRDSPVRCGGVLDDFCNSAFPLLHADRSGPVSARPVRLSGMNDRVAQAEASF
jgi:hypothetical protein